MSMSHFVAVGFGISHLRLKPGFFQFIPNLPNRKYYLTTKRTKDTKVSDNDISKLLNFVLFVTFVVKSVSTFWLRLRRAVSFVVIYSG
jgi:hypothetical protein